MKKIYFIRHAKAKKEGDSDFLRKLSQRGKDDAKTAGMKLKQSKITPDIICTSSAKRAFDTAKIIAEELRYNGKFIALEELYNITSDELLSFIQEIDDSNKSVFIVGHNPTTTEICEVLSDSAIGHIPTSGIFGINFDVDKFENIERYSGEIIMFDYPKK